MAEYVLSPEALIDLQGIWDFIDNPDAADRTINELYAAFEYLAEWPGSGHTRRDLTPSAVRFWPVGSYLVLYREKSIPLQIVTVVHGARDISALLGDI
jgi:plasmid stabilization system protein ParE